MRLHPQKFRYEIFLILNFRTKLRKGKSQLSNDEVSAVYFSLKEYEINEVLILHKSDNDKGFKTFINKGIDMKLIRNLPPRMLSK